jgi:hypothetical protein
MIDRTPADLEMTAKLGEQPRRGNVHHQPSQQLGGATRSPLSLERLTLEPGVDLELSAEQGPPSSPASISDPEGACANVLGFQLH